ncbi:MAG: hypothetical protein ABI981_11370, partial [Betaproteobacteria bacterium]
MAAVFRERRFDVLVDHQGFAGAQDMGADADFADRIRGDVDTLATHGQVGEAPDAGLPVDDADFHVGAAENLADLVADRIVDALHVEFGGERLLHAVDDGELCGALFRFLEQPLRIFEQPGVLQRDTHAGGHRREQAHLGLAESVGALGVLQCDGTQRALARVDGHHRRRLGGLPAFDITQAPGLHLRPRVRDHGALGVEGLGHRALRVHANRWQIWPCAVLVIVQPVHQRWIWEVSVPPTDGDVPRVEHFAQLVPDEVDDGLEVEFRRHALLNAVDDR